MHHSMIEDGFGQQISIEDDVSATSEFLSITVAVEGGLADVVFVPWLTAAEDLIAESA